jgi:tetratricopeptide (TPR) repeat protein
MSCVAAGNFRAAVDAIDEALRLSGEGDAALAALGYAYARRGDRAQAIEILDRFRAQDGAAAGGSGRSPYSAALILAGLDRDDDAIAFLGRALAARDARLPELGVDPAWDGLRDDPRFSALLGEIGLAR